MQSFPIDLPDQISCSTSTLKSSHISDHYSHRLWGDYIAAVVSYIIVNIKINYYDANVIAKTTDCIYAY